MQYSLTRDFLDHVLHDWNFTCASINDILIASFSMEEYMQKLQLICEWFTKFGVTNLKCEFGKLEVIFFGHHINSSGISLVPSQATSQFPILDRMEKLWQSLEIINFFCRLLHNCAQIVKHFDRYFIKCKKLWQSSVWFCYDSILQNWPM